MNMSTETFFLIFDSWYLFYVREFILKVISAPSFLPFYVNFVNEDRYIIYALYQKL